MDVRFWLLPNVLASHARRGFVTAGVLLCALAITSCGGGIKAGSAATVGDTTLSEGLVANISEEITTVVGDTQPSQPLPADQINTRIVALWVDEELTEALGAARGVTVTDAQVDAVLGKFDTPTRIDIAAGLAIPPSQLERAVRVDLMRQSLAADLAPEGDEAAQSAALIAGLSETADDLGVSVNPRFGTWDPSLWMTPTGDPTAPRVDARAADRLSSPSATDTAAVPLAPAAP